MKMKGIEMLYAATQFKLSHKGPNEGSGVTPAVPVEPRDISSSSSLESGDEIEDISSDEERSKAYDIVKVDAEKTEGEKAEEEKAKEEQHVDDEGGNEQAADVQAEVYISEPQTKKPSATLISSSLTLSSAEYTNSFSMILLM
ncbi:hypothetical protein Tco_0148352, partial [Tanacetum coccineum]